MFKIIVETDLSASEKLGYFIRGFDAVDLERNLVLSTTNGRTRGARRWFVNRLTTDFHRDFDVGKVTFRAWTLKEAMERLNEPRIQKRIDKLVAAERARKE